MKTSKLTKQEKKYIIDDLLSALESVYLGHINLTPSKLAKMTDKSFDIKEGEFNMCVSIIKKLSGG